MSSIRSGHTATLLQNGKVLVTGGRGSSTYLKTAEIYDPTAGTWSSAGQMSEARTAHSATLLNNGDVLIVGGYASGYPSISEIYRTGTNTWLTGPTTTPRAELAATRLNDGRVLVSGGYSGSGDLPSADIYNPVSNTWAATGPMNEIRTHHDNSMLLLADGRVIVMGYFQPSVEIYTP
jgi:hypothetical protein